MKQKPLLKCRKRPKSYPLNQCAMFNTSSRARLQSLLCLPLSVILESIGQYNKFDAQPKFDPFSAKPPRKVRHVQKPKGDLLKIHNRILKLLKFVEVPEYMQAALAGTSYRKNAFVHRAGSYVATLDIRDFFGATNGSKVFNFFESALKCPGDISSIYSKLLTCEDALPTGSPISPLMSFYANKNLFDELNLLAQENGLIFTCYVDDLTFSGSYIDGRFIWEVERLVRRYGHAVAARKTKLFKDGCPKHITGVVLMDNEIKVPDSRYRKLRLLTAALEGKFESHGYSEIELLNKRAGVLGEIAYLDPEKKFLALRAIEGLKQRKFKLLGDGKLKPWVRPIKTISIDDICPWEAEPTVSD